MLAVHITFGAYGFWLPNDPRGSGSSEVRAQHVYEAGGIATKVEDRKYSRASQPHDRALRLATKRALVRPPVKFTGIQARAVARGITMVLPRTDLQIYALSIMPDHLHAVVRSRAYAPDQIVSFLKASGSRGLSAEGVHPFADDLQKHGSPRTPWQKYGWKVFLFTEDEVRQRIRYVEENPLKAGLKRQHWGCVIPFTE